MKIKFNRAALQEVLSLVTSVVPSRTPKPILQCLRINCEKDAAMICATDLEVGINCQVVQVEIETAGDIVLDADKLASIVRESVDDVVEIATEESTITIKGSDSIFTIYGHEPSQYPAVPGFGGKADFEIDLGKLQEGIEHTVFAVAKESTRYALNGILWETSKDGLTLVATDGRRLARSVVSLDGAEKINLPEGKIIVPAKTMSLLDRVGGDEKTKVAVRFVDNQIVLMCGQVVISSNLIEGNFPQYEDIIPSDSNIRLELPTEATLSAVRRAALLATEDSKGIKLSLKKNLLVFSGRAAEIGDAEIDMGVDYSGDEMSIGFNPQFLIDVLRVLKSDSFILELGESDRPGVIRCGDDFLYIVMPVNL